MNERTLTARESSGGPAGLGSIFDETDPLPGQVSVSSGPFSESLPLTGRTVGEVRRLLGPRFDIAPGSQAVVNGQDVNDDVVLQQGQALAFTHRAGEKGRRSP